MDPFFCNLPAGGKLPPKKRATEKKMRIKERKEEKKWKKKKEGKEGRKNEKKRGLRDTFFTLNFLKHL